MKDFVRLGGAQIGEFSIVYSKDEPEPVLHAAEEIAKYVSILYETEPLPIYTDKNKIAEKTIILGDLTGLPKPEGEEAYIIVCDKNRSQILIQGANPRGIIYGSYAFLEEICTWRFISPDIEYNKIAEGRTEPYEIGNKKIEWNPIIEWRDVASPIYWNDAVSIKRRLNSSYNRHCHSTWGGTYEYPGRFIHTFESLLGVPQHTQPCLSDPTVLEKCINSVRELLRQNPNARVISVSQNDCDIDEKTYCTCPKCAKIDEEEGSHAGTLLRFVNKVAEAVEEEFPKCKIMTLAYIHTIKIPKITRPHKNVIIEFAPINMDFGHSVRSEGNRATLKDFEDWSTIADRIFVWDYQVNFSFSVPHFPNFKLLRDNMKYYVDHNVKGFFMEGDNHSEYRTATDMGEYKAYLLANLLCNPYMSDSCYRTVCEDFLYGFYGKKGYLLTDYLDILGELAEKNPHPLGIFENPNTMYDKEKFLAKLPEMEAIWNEVETGAENEFQRENVTRSRLGYTYLKLLYGFDLFCQSGEPFKSAILKENENFYKTITAIGTPPRGIGTKVPELTDMSENMGIKIYW